MIQKKPFFIKGRLFESFIRSGLESILKPD